MGVGELPDGVGAFITDAALLNSLFASSKSPKSASSSPLALRVRLSDLSRLPMLGASSLGGEGSSVAALAKSSYNPTSSETFPETFREVVCKRDLGSSSIDVIGETRRGYEEYGTTHSASNPTRRVIISSNAPSTASEWPSSVPSPQPNLSSSSVILTNNQRGGTRKYSRVAIRPILAGVAGRLLRLRGVKTIPQASVGHAVKDT